MDRKLMLLVALLFWSIAFSTLLMSQAAQAADKPDRAVANGVAGANEAAKVIRLKSEVFVPAGDADANFDRVKVKHPKRAVVRVILQFEELPDAARRKQLEAQGVRLLGYLPDNAFFASVPVKVKVDQPFRAASRLRWLGAIYREDKTAPRLRGEGFGAWALRPGGTVDLRLSCFEDADLNAVAAAVADLGGQVIDGLAELHRLTVNVPTGVLDQLADLDEVRWIEEVPPPPRALNDGSRANAQADIVEGAPYNLSGNGVALGIWDSGRVDANHDDFAGRITIAESSTISDHATHVAGTMAGSGALSVSRGGTALQWRGMAPAAQIISYDFNGNVIAEHNTPIRTQGIVLSQNSWGVSIDSLFGNCSMYGDYSSFAPEFDQIVTGLYGRGINVVFAAGNSRNNGDCGLVGGAPNFINYRCINPPATAKNVISVGAINSDNNTITEFTSWGPVDDGRLKPDLVAPGCEAGGEEAIKSTLPGDSYGGAFYCGTSMAAPAVSGCIALLVEDFRARFGTNPWPSTVRGLLLHTVTDMDNGTSWYNKGPDYASGYGRLQVQAAVDQMRSGGFLVGEVGHRETNSYVFSLPAGITQVKLTLVWDDPAGQENAAVALVNDLDLIVHDPNNSRKFPWTLDPANPPAPAVRNAEDHLNVIEQVFVDAGVVAGAWVVRVAGRNIPAGRQGYTLVYSIPRPVITVASHQLAIETCGSGNGMIDPYEIVSVDFTFRNVGSLATSDLVATLLPSANVISPSGPQTIGILPGGGGEEVGRFTFKPAGECGAMIPLQFQLNDGANDLGIATFAVQLGPLDGSDCCRPEGLSVSVSDLPNPVIVGSNLTYTVTVINSGATAATGVQLTDILPPSVSVVSVNASQGSCNQNGNQINCDFGSIAAGGAATLTVAVAPGSVGTITNQANVVGNEADPEPLNNSVVTVTTVNPLEIPDLIANEVRGPAVGSTGGTLQVTNEVQNVGTSNAVLTFRIAFYLSEDTIITTNDVFLGSRSIFGLAAGDNTRTVTPATVPVDVDPGVYYFGALVDFNEQIREGNELNNEFLVETMQVVLGPDVSVTSLTAPAVGSIGGTVALTNITRNFGAGNPGNFSLGYYLSTDSLITTNDTLVGTQPVNGLVPGGSFTGFVNAAISPSFTAGLYYYGAIADFTSAVPESNEDNNALAGGTIDIRLGLDLATRIVSGPTNSATGNTISITNVVENIGSNNATAFGVGFYLSPDAVITTTDQRLGVRNVTGLAVGVRVTNVLAIAIPLTNAARTYFFGGIADYANALPESNETNNILAGNTIVIEVGPDHTMTVFNAPSRASPGGTIQVSNVVANIGVGDSPAFMIGFYLSTDPVISTADQRIGTRALAALLAGSNNVANTTLSISSTQALGTYYLGAIADYLNVIPERNESNNTIVAVGTFEISRGFDATVAALSGPTNAYTGGLIVLSNVVENLGIDTIPLLTNGYYLSTDPIILTNDIRIGTRTITNLAGGQRNTNATSLTVPVTVTPGSYYIGAIADFAALVPESNETNNSLLGNMVAIEIGPDLTATLVKGPTSAAQSTTVLVTNVVANVGYGNPGPFTVGIYVSSSATVTTNDLRVGTRLVSGLAPGTVSTAVTSVAITNVLASGNYCWGMIADYTNGVVERNETNNALTSCFEGGSGFACRPAIDLIVTHMSGPFDSCTGNPFDVTNVVSNIGTAPAGNVIVGLYMSTDDVITTDDFLIGTRTIPSIPVGGSRTNYVQFVAGGALPGGRYYFGSIVDPDDRIAEVDEANNGLLGNTFDVTVGPDLVVNDIITPAFASQGGKLPVTSLIANQGCGTAPANFAVSVYLSTNPVITTADTLLGSRTVSTLGWGLSNTGTTLVTISPTLPSGTYYVGVIADSGNTIFESIETNNVLLGTPVIIRPAADLLIGHLSGPSNACTANIILLSNVVMNTGTDQAGTFAVGFYLSTDTNITTADLRVSVRTVPGLAVGQTNAAVTSVTIPTTLAAGTYFLGAIADYANAFPELDETNNAACGNLIEIAIGPELIMTEVSGPTAGAQGSTIIVTNVVHNIGCGDASSFAISIYLSTDPVITTSDPRIGVRALTSLTAGNVNTGLTTVVLSSTLSNGVYYLGAIADYAGAVIEVNDTNNALTTMTITIRPGIDLTVLSVAGATNAATGTTISLTNIFENVGTDYAPTSTYGIYLSTDPVIDTNDVRIGTAGTSPLSPGQSVTNIGTAVLPTTVAPGVYYFGVIADYANALPESDETNNGRAGNIVEIVAGPDLIVNTITGPATVGVGATFNVTNTAHNVGVGGVNTSFRIAIYLSLDALITPSDSFLGWRQINTLAVGQTNRLGTSVVLSNSVAPGSYYIGAIADYDGRIAETSEVNNGALGYSIQIDPLRITSIRIEGADVVITFNSVVGKNYRLQRANSLNGTITWTSIGATLVGNGGQVTARDIGAASSGNWFYRLLLL